MTRKIRVYELAAELGLTNKEALELCLQLGIGVRSHSSSIEEAQADRVRRRVDAAGLRRAPAQQSSGGEPAQKETSAPVEEASRSTEPPREAQVSVLARQGEHRLVTGRVGGAATLVRKAAGQRELEVAETPAPEATSSAEPASSPGRELASSAASPLAGQAVPSAAAAPLPGEAKAPEAAASALAAPAAPPEAPSPPPAASRPPLPPLNLPRSPSGRPIPPPPRPPAGKPVPPPRSPSGRPIPPPPRPPAGKPVPPPPGAGGQSSRPSGQRSGQGRPGSERPRGPYGPGGRQGGAGGGGRLSGAPSRPSIPRSPAPSVPPPSRNFGRGRPPQRAPRRRRRSMEEIEPTQITVYTPSNAPVPDHEVIIERGSTAQEVGPKLNRSAGDVVRFLLLQGEMVTATQPLSDEMIELFAAEIGARVRLVDPGEEQEAELEARLAEEEPEDPSELVPRPPVVTVMGHVDHGKTLLLDRIRQTNVVAGEAGGITQHIGAYQVQLPGGELITFIDTPGHEAFTAMRARGAKVTDIVVLVVAADDGVMPQTVEAIDHAKAAGVPIVVAVNKIDRPDADVNRTLQQLAEHGLVPEAWGGDTITVEISALQNLGIDELLEQILVLAEVMELKANPHGRARGVVLEANLDVGRGPVATVIVQKGCLEVGDWIVAGAAWGRVKALLDERGNQVKQALPSTPVQVLGFSDVPAAGDQFWVTQDQATAKAVGEARARRQRLAGHAAAAPSAGARLQDLIEQVRRGETATLNVILKADAQGSLEALSEALRKLEREDVKLSIIHKAVGGINENNVMLAAASNATIIGFNVRPDRNARELAAAQKVEIRTYDVIYKLIEDLEAAMAGLLTPQYEEVVTGEAEVREIFRVPRVGAVAGCYVRSGSIQRGAPVRFLRDGVVIWKGNISSLKRFKEDVREVQAGFECGVGLSDFQDLRRGDIIETYELREVPRT